MEDKKEEKPETLPAEVRSHLLSSETSIYFNVALFEQCQRVATIFSNSTMIPERFRKNVGNCMIALNFAHRLNADELMVFQNLYEVYGTPGISGKLVEAIINASNKYSEPLQYEWLDAEDNVVERRKVLKADVPSEYGCQAFTIDRKSNQRVTGPKITWALIKIRGWYDRKGLDKTLESNNWRTMPEMMFYYRCASWFSNKNCPELTLGMPTVEELHDITDLSKQPDGSYAAPVSLNDKLKPTKEKKTEGKDPYEAKTTGETEEKEEKEEDYETWGKLKFKKWCKAEVTRNTISGMDARHQAKIYKRWQKDFPSEDFPTSEVAEKPPVEDQGEEAEKHPTETEAMLALVDGAKLTDSGIAVPCPQQQVGVSILRNKCEGIGLEKCKERQECPTWKEWDKRSK